MDVQISFHENWVLIGIIFFSISAAVAFGIRNLRLLQKAEAELQILRNIPPPPSPAATDQGLELALAEQKVTEFADSLPLLLYEIDPLGNFTFVNKTALKMFGYSREEFENGVNSLSMVAPEDRKRAMVNIERRLNGEDFEAEEYTIMRRDGTRFPMLIHSGAIVKNGAVVGVRGLAIDLTERKKAEQAIRESEDKYRGLFEESRDVIFVSTPDGRFLDINPAGSRLFGYPSKEALLAVDIARDIYCREQDREDFYNALKRSGYVKDYEIDMKTRDGERLTTLITCVAVYDADGNISELRGMIRDITEYKLLEAQLRQAQKMEAVGQLAGGIAHDFNNILTTMIGYADLLKSHIRENDISTKYLDELILSVERASSLTGNLLAFSRKQTLKVSPVDANDIVRSVDLLLSRLIGEDIEVRTRFAQRSLMILADSAQIEQVMLNIATNARDAMPDGGVLEIETSCAELDRQLIKSGDNTRPGPHAIISITDSGTGMDDKTIDKIFEPFFTTKEVGKGTGLGLAMSYGIITQHEGHIFVKSRPGSGTTFMIYLPLIKSTKTAKESCEREDDFMLSATSGTILIAEDNSAVRKLTRIILEKAGYKVIEAIDGDDAVAKFSSHAEIDLVILDVVMPKKDGRQVYEEIIKIKPEARVLLATGYTTDVLRRKGVLDKGPQMLQKPIPPRELLRKVNEALHTSHES